MKLPDDWNSLPLVLDMNDLQRILRLSRTSCFQPIHQRGFPARQVTSGGTVRIGRDALFKWLEKAEHDEPES